MIRTLGVLLVVACTSPTATETRPATPTPTPAPVAPVPTPVPSVPLPEPAAPIAAAELAKDHSCGSFSSKQFSSDVAMLDDRFRVKFVPGAKVEGSNASQRAVVEKGGTSVFVGARELYMEGDADFAKHATKSASFDGGYDPMTIPARDGVSIVAGFLKTAPGNSELVAVAHGWFLNGTKDVLDVAVFASNITDTNLAECRLFAAKAIANVTLGPRKLAFGTGATVETKVSYATFRYVLPANWIQSTEMGIHDFARMTFRYRGVYPTGFTELQLGLDSHPGDWQSPGNPDGTKAGKLFGLDVTWTQTKGTGIAGAWTVSKDVRKRDHAVASVISGSAAGRDAAIKFADSITAK